MKKIALWLYQNEGGDKITQRLVTHLLNKGFEVIHGFDLRKAYLLNESVITDEGINLSDADLLYYMNADEQSSHQLQILQFLEISGVKLINPFTAHVTARDKLMCNLKLRQAGISVPAVLLTSNRPNRQVVNSFFKQHGSVVVKPRSNHGGRGILKFSNASSFLDYAEMVEEFFANHYLEAFIEFGYKDYRVEIVNDAYVGGYRRERKHAFKTNIGSGGSMIATEPEDDVIKLAMEAAKVMKMDCTIIDIVRCLNSGQLYILEVNPIMGIFLEQALQSGYKLPTELDIDPLFRTDNKKIDKLLELIDIRTT